MLKLVTVVGTRPEIIRLSRVLSALDLYCDHILVHTGQNYDYELNIAHESSSPSESIGNLIISIDKLLDNITPDALLVLGDTNSCLSVIPAKRRRITVFHMEAGNRCFDMRVPEEINRRIVDHASDINLTYSSIAREYLLREGLPPDQVIKTGSPMFEVLNYYRSRIDQSDVLQRLSLNPYGYFLVSAHRQENIDSEKNFDRLVTILNSLASDYDLPVIVSTHPRTQNRIKYSDFHFHSNIRFLKPLGFYDYNHLQIFSKVVLSDSGTISEESSILNFPALNIREAHERPEGMEEAVVMMPGLNLDRITQCLRVLDDQPRGLDRTASGSMRLPIDYSCPNVSDKIVRIILSYTDYIQRVVWKDF